MSANLIQSVIVGVVEAVGVSGLSEASSGLHLLLLLVQQHLQRGHHRYSLAPSEREQPEGCCIQICPKTSLGCLHLQVLNHGGVLDVLGLQADFNRRQMLSRNSDIHRNSHFCHSPPDVNLKAKRPAQFWTFHTR